MDTAAAIARQRHGDHAHPSFATQTRYGANAGPGTGRLATMRPASRAWPYANAGPGWRNGSAGPVTMRLDDAVMRPVPRDRTKNACRTQSACSGDRRPSGTDREALAILA